jgi:caffeoyl-CoA O-methyltransferase
MFSFSHYRYKLFFFLIFFISLDGLTQTNDQKDKQIEKFLEEKKGEWRDLNVPFEDGKVIHDLIVENGYTSALEIGTSTGHSTLWIAWALRKTGGKLITLEIDERRQRLAIQNIEAAGLQDYVDFRLGNAHEIVRELEGPFDFIFSDADKDWYIQYFKDLNPKILPGGVFTAHNVLQNISGIREFVEYVQKHPDYDTQIDRTSWSGISISRKK